MQRHAALATAFVASLPGNSITGFIALVSGVMRLAASLISSFAALYSCKLGTCTLAVKAAKASLRSLFAPFQHG